MAIAPQKFRERPRVTSIEDTDVFPLSRTQPDTSKVTCSITWGDMSFQILAEVTENRQEMVDTFATQQAWMVAELATKATPADITAAINALVAGAPAALDTLLEIANRLATDESAVTALTGTVAGKMAIATYDTNANGIVDAAESAPWSGITGKPTTFTPAAHTHVIADTTGLQTALDAKMAAPLPMSLSTPARTINGTPFQIHATKPVLLTYTFKCQVTNPLIAGNSTGTVRVLSDSATVPTIERGRVEAVSSVGVAVAIAITTSNTATITYLVPAGHYVKIEGTTSGTATNTFVAQAEEIIG